MTYIARKVMWKKGINEKSLDKDETKLYSRNYETKKKKLEENFLCFITTYHCSPCVSLGPIAPFPLIGNEAQLPCSGPSRQGLDCCHLLGQAKCDKSN